MLARWLDGRQVRAVQLLAGGLMNRNCRVRIDSPPESVVLRLYDRDPGACAKEVALLELLRRTLPVPAVLYAEPAAGDAGPPFAVLSFVDGISLRELALTGDHAAIGEAAYHAGRLLGRLQTYAFPRSGLLTAALTVDSGFVDGPLTTTSVIELFAQSPAFGRRMDARLHDRLLRAAQDWDVRFAAADDGAALVHGDFNSRNIFVAEREGRWTVAAILDWEFAFAGSVYCDIGNFLRYERPTRPRFEPFFSRGCQDAGVELRTDWLTASRMADLPALCELLSRASTPDDLVEEILELVAATVDQRERGESGPP
jgi:aminoglycoside phosphotransferase (APT) family kinase protein